ncbi:MAG: ABC transporter ATP-binding protein [Leptospiraceae bacterium]|nr:ABC transporter ATP-binding protein [Leptospiraceae bacterium]
MDHKVDRDTLLEILNNFGRENSIEVDSLRFLNYWEEAYREFGETTDKNLYSWLKFLGEKFQLRFFQQMDSLETLCDISNLKEEQLILLKEISTGDVSYHFIKKSFGPFVRLISAANTNHSKLITKRKLTSSYEKVGEYSYFSEPVYPFNLSHKGDHHHLEPLERIVKILELEREDIWIITAYSIGIVLLSLVVPVATQSLVNILSFGTLIQPLIILTLLVIVALGFAGVFLVYQTKVVEFFQQRLFVRISLELAEVLSRFNPIKDSKKRKDELVNYFLDVSIIQKSATVLLVDGVSIILQFFVGLLVLVLYHPFFILFDVLVVGLIYFLVINFFGKNAINTSIAESVSKHKLTTWFEEIVRNPESFRSKNSRELAMIKTEYYTKNYIEARKKHYSILIRQIGTLVGIQAIGSAFVLGVGGYLVIKGELSLGQLVAAEIITTKILDNFRKMGKYLESYYDLSASMDKIGHLTDIEMEPDGLHSIGVVESLSLKLKEVELKIPEKPYTLKINNLEISAGDKIGILTEPSSSVHYFLHLIFGMIKPDQGYIEVNGYSLDEINKSELRKYISYSKGGEIFTGTILENIRKGRVDIDTSEVRHILEKVNILEEITREFSEGLSTQVYSSGYPLNQEQKIKINIARTILAKPKLIIWDEALNYISNNEWNKIQKNILLDMDPKTIIIASASDKNKLKFCNKLLSFDDGILNYEEKK